MLPHDMQPEALPMPSGDRYSAVFFSSSGIRHQRLGYLIQQRFPGLMKAWWMYAPKQSARLQTKVKKALGMFKTSQTGAEALALVREGDVGGLVDIARRRVRGGDLQRLARLARAYTKRSNYGQVEREMFGAELAALKAEAELHPEACEESPNKKARLAALKQVNPYFIITFGGPLLGARVLRRARGFAINQHAGWSPALKGASTTETALYHRNLNWVGNTVHLMDTHADSGHILRRSTATLHPDDDPAHCFFSVCAVGSKMMLEVIDSALNDDALAVHPQPRGGQTVLNIDFTPMKREAIARDMAAGWLADALRAVTNF